MAIEVISNTTDFFGDMSKDIIATTGRAMSAAGREMTAIQRANIKDWGLRSDTGKWRPVSPGWLAVREMFPHGSKAENKAYMDSHTPLIDTETMYNSVGEVQEQTEKDITVWSGAGVSYAKDHIEGKSSSGEPKQLTQRDFAFVTQDDVDGRITNAILETFQREA